jgi:tetratricopeptide (TPR) repeat protein
VRNAASRRAILLTALVSTLGLVASCAPRGARPTAARLADLARADALVRDGCYRCLQEAREIYAATYVIASSRRSPPDPALRKEFDTTLLLVARAKELGLAFESDLTRARELLKKQQNTAGSHRQPQSSQSSAEDPSARLEAVEAIVGDLTGLDSEERLQRDERVENVANETAAVADRSTRVQALRQSAATDLTSAYILLALECDRPARRQATTGRLDVSTPAPDAPLWRYRLALCGLEPSTVSRLSALREHDRRWAETFYFEGKTAMGSPARAAEPTRAATLLTSAAQAFPDSIPAHMLLGSAHEMNGDAANALAAFDRVLAIKPAHVDAQIGRVRNLSYLGRTDEGIAAATAMIDRGTWHVGDAYYWRAWNGYQARRLEAAWADVQQSMTLLSNTAVYALAGSIAYARKELDVAVRHFTRAFEIDPSNCLAIASAGLVHADQTAWPSAAGDHVKATRCFAQAAAAAKADLAKLTAASLDPAEKARRIASTEKRRESAEELGAQAALGAAESFVRMADNTQALTYIELAERHPATSAKAAALRARMVNRASTASKKTHP